MLRRAMPQRLDHSIITIRKLKKRVEIVDHQILSYTHYMHAFIEKTNKCDRLTKILHTNIYKYYIGSNLHINNHLGVKEED